MKRRVLVGGIVMLASMFSARQAGGQQPAPPATPTAQRALMNQYCVTCHSDKLKTGGLTLEKLDTANVTADAETWEKVMRKVTTGMMPPAGARRPDRPTLEAFAAGPGASPQPPPAPNPTPRP